MRTLEEISARIKALEVSNEDFFGFIRGDLLGFLPFNLAKPHLKEGVTEEEWTPKTFLANKDTVLAQMKDYMSFAWEKANDCRGLSAARSIDHMQAWLWLLGEEKVADEIRDYEYYGKPQLRAICEHYGWDWRKWDDDLWTEGEDSRGYSADKIGAAELSWNP